MAEIDGHTCSDFERDLYKLAEMHASRATDDDGRLQVWAHISGCLTYLSSRIAVAYGPTVSPARIVGFLTTEHANAIAYKPNPVAQALLDTLSLPPHLKVSELVDQATRAELIEKADNVIALPAPKPKPEPIG